MTPEELQRLGFVPDALSQDSLNDLGFVPDQPSVQNESQPLDLQGEEETSWLNQYIARPAAQFAKGVAQGAAGLGDMANLAIQEQTNPDIAEVFNTDTNEVRKAFDQNQSIEDKTGKGIDAATNNYTVPQNFLERGSNLSGKFLGGSLGQPSTVIPSIASGFATEAVKEAGGGPMAQLGAGLLGGAAPSALKATAASNPVLKSVGLGKNDINKRAFDTFEKLGIEPAAKDITDSRNIGIIDDFIKRVPFVGESIRKKEFLRDEQFQKAWSQYLEKIGPEATEANKAQYSKMYDVMRKELPDKVPVKTQGILEEITKAKKKLTTSSPTTEEKSALATLDELEKAYTHTSQLFTPRGKKLGMSQTSAKETDLKTLIGTKKSIGKKINWDTKDPDVREVLKPVRRKMVETIGEELNAYPNIKQNFESAEKLYGSIAKRKDLDNTFKSTIEHAITGKPQHGQFVRKFARKELMQDFKRKLGQEGYDDLKDFVRVSQRIAKGIDNTVNKSGSGFTAQALEFVKGLGKVGTGVFAVANPTASISMTLYAKRLLTNPEVLKKARKLADKPTPSKAEALERVVKRHTGITLANANQLLQEQQ